jgi:hypothetical protein
LFDRNRLLSLLLAGAEVLHAQSDEDDAEHRRDRDRLCRAH